MGTSWRDMRRGHCCSKGADSSGAFPRAWLIFKLLSRTDYLGDCTGLYTESWVLCTWLQAGLLGLLHVMWQSLELDVLGDGSCSGYFVHWAGPVTAWEWRKEYKHFSSGASQLATVNPYEVEEGSPVRSEWRWGNSGPSRGTGWMVLLRLFEANWPQIMRFWLPPERIAEHSQSTQWV